MRENLQENKTKQNRGVGCLGVKTMNFRGYNGVQRYTLDSLPRGQAGTTFHLMRKGSQPGLDENCWKDFGVSIALEDMEVFS